MTGAATAGKTCTKHYIFDIPPPDQYTSTDVFESMERHYAYYTATVDPNDPCKWMIATLDTTLAMIKSCVSSKREKNLEFDNKLGFDVQTDSPPMTSNTDTQVDPELADESTPMTNAPVQPKLETGYSVTERQSDAIRKLLDPRLKMSGEVLNVRWIHFVDGGGQSEFLELLPALVSNVTVTIYVIDLTRKPDATCNDHFTINDQPQGTRETHLTGEEILKRFLKTISSQKEKVKKEKEEEKREEKEKKEEEEKRKVMFVGTHYDSPEALSNLEKWNESIKDFWKEFHLEKKVIIIKTDKKHNIHAINANYRGNDDNQHQTAAKYMRQELANCCVERKVAIADFLIEEDLKSSPLAQEHHGILSYSECKEITKEYVKESTLKRALQYFHELNEFLFFQFEDSDDLVFTKPSVLVQIISKLIKVAYDCRTDSTSFPQFWKLGIISNKDLNDILDYPLPHEELQITRYYRPSTFVEKQLLKVLQTLYIAAPRDDCSEHFIPCVLPPCSNIEDINEITSDFMKDNHPLLLTFKGGSIPRGLFCRLVTYLMDKCGWKIRPGNDQNYRTLIEFVITTEMYKLVLVEEFELIRVHVAQEADESVHLDIRKKIAAGVEAVSKNFYGSEGDSIIDPSVSFQCLCSYSKKDPTLPLYLMRLNQKNKG